MYQNIHIDRNEGYVVHLWDDRTGYTSFPYKPYCYQLDEYGEYETMFGTRAKKIYKWAGEDKATLFESDVPHSTRVLVDTYLDNDEPSTGHRTMFFDIEVEMISGIPDPELGNCAITSIAAYDDVSEEYRVFILDENNELEDSNEDITHVYRFDSEKELLLSFIDYWERLGPTIITGWNSNGFDVPYLYNRLVTVFDKDTASRLSPIGIVIYQPWKKQYKIAGVSHLDYMQLYKTYTYTQESSYSLNNIAKKELKRGKIEYEGTLDQLMREDIHKFIQYNITDVELLVEIDKKNQFIELARLICHYGHVPYEEYNLSSKFLEGSILVYLKRLGLVACNKPDGGQHKLQELKAEGKKGFDGAYVKDPQVGLHNWLYDLDLTSLYPSIIMSLNISPETKFAKIDNWDVDAYLKGLDVEWSIDGNLIHNSKFIEFMKTSNLSVASNGVLYRTDVKGCVPEILKTWFDTRREYQKLMKKYGTEGDDIKYQFYKKRQLVQKVLLNSMYGGLGLPVFRFYDVDNAEAVTTVGQSVIKNTANAANMKYNSELNKVESGGARVDVDYVIYVDT